MENLWLDEVNLLWEGGDSEAARAKCSRPYWGPSQSLGQWRRLPAA